MSSTPITFISIKKDCIVTALYVLLLIKGLNSILLNRPTCDDIVIAMVHRALVFKGGQ